MFAPFHHHLVEIGQRVPDIHDQHQPAQAAAVVQVVAQMFLPVIFHVPGNLGIAIPGQVHQAAMFPVEGEEVDQARAPRGFTGAGQFAVGGDAIDRAGFARVRAPGKGDFSAMVRWTFFQARGAGQKAGAVKRDAFLSQIR